MIQELPQITAADVLSRDRRYAAAELENLLGIPAGVTLDAIRKNEFADVTNTREIQGSSVLGWIARHDIEYEATPLAIKLHRQQRQRELAENERRRQLYPAPGELNASDVITPGDWYTPATIEAVLAVPVARMEQAAARCELPKRKAGETWEFHGAELLDWLWNHDVPHKVREQADVEITGSADDALKVVRQSQLNDVATEAERQAHAWRIYVACLQRDDLSRAEVHELAGAVADLGINEQQLAEDRETIRKARRAMELRDDRDAANKRRMTAIDAYRATQVRHKAELDAEWQKKRVAEREHSQCAQAVERLESLRRKRPELFEPGLPPRLIEPKPTP